MCKTCWTFTQKTHGIWWYECGHGKPRRKTSMMFIDAIHVQAKERGKNNNVEAISTLEVDDCLCAIQGHLQKL